jgi:molecular chaperone DnaK
MTDTPCFGIDLGTSASAIGWVRDGHPELLGDGLVPSVAFAPEGDGPLVVGDEAVRAEPLHPERVIRSAKRFMGTDHAWDLGDRTVTPVDVSAAILRHLCGVAETATGVRPERVVITVPAWFTQAQRADTRAAGTAAGLEVARLVNEPTAAALAHAHGKPLHRRVLVYDFGGGTFDVSLVAQDGPILEVRASHGDVRLGGDDVDAGILTWVAERLAEEDPALGAAIEASPLAQRKLRTAAEEAKHLLSERPEAPLAVPYIAVVDGSPRHLDLRLPREELEEIVMPLLGRTLDLVDAVLADVGVRPDEIDGLLLVGGSIALPQVYTSLKRRYGLDGDAGIPPRRAVALGAAIQAAIVDGSRVDGVLVDVAPYPIAIGAMTGGIPGYPTHFTCEVITPRNSPLPSHHTHLFRTGHPTQDRVRLPVYQGSDPDPRNNVILGEVVLDEIPAAPPGELFRPIAIEVAHDLDGTVEITIRDQLSDRVVSGHVVADGSEVEALRASWEAHIRSHDLTPGDPFALADPDAAVLDEATGKAAEALFATIARSPELDAEAPDDADRLRALARAGEVALAGGATEAIAIYERLQDELFEAGVYL